jgi:EAL domain-containing protein (putative c-di-GMP-specific phosphodiesterase class I)
MRKFRRQALASLEGQSAHDEWTDLRTRFERALDRISIVYQPILRARNGSLFGYEGLIRCEDGDFSAPDLLVAATRLGEVTRLGRVIRSCVTEALLADPNSTLFLNIHPLDLVDPDLHDYRRELTRMAQRVVLELSENLTLQDIGCAQPMLASLRDRGFRMAIVNTGVGQFGPKNFAILSPEFVKLDPSLVSGLDVSTSKRELVGSMTTYFRTLGLSVIADGVQTPWERRWATELGCDLLQGGFLPPTSFPAP